MSYRRPLALSLAMTAGCAHVTSCVPQRAAAFDAVAQTIDSLRRAANVPGLAIAIVANGEVVLARGYGYADVEARRAADPDTPFNIASVSKPISAVVALHLVERHTLDLDRPMTSYEGFAEFCTEARQAGGIFFRDYACLPNGSAPPLTLRHVLSMTANGDTPGTRFLYNPPSYSWASRPMMQVTGVAFSTLVDSLVFRPAAMRNSARTNRQLPLRADLAPRLALPYHVDSAAPNGALLRSTPPAPQGDGAAGGVVSTANDLARFDLALDGGRLLDDSLRALLWTPTRTASGATLPYGLGWFVQNVDGRRVVWHTGLWEGRYSALYLKVPDERLTLILLANSDGLNWPMPLDSADIRGSAFARTFLDATATSSCSSCRRGRPVPSSRSSSRASARPAIAIVPRRPATP